MTCPYCSKDVETGKLVEHAKTCDEMRHGVRGTGPSSLVKQKGPVWGGSNRKPSLDDYDRR